MSGSLESYLARELGWHGLRVVERPALEHQSNRLYDAWVDGQHLIVKEFVISDEWADAPVREFGAMERLAPLDIAPRPVLYVPAGRIDTGRPLVVYEFLEGEMWDRGERTAADLLALAEGWQRINSLAPEGLWYSRGHDRIGYAPFVERMRQHLVAYAAWAEREFPAGCAAVAQCEPLVVRGREAALRLEQLEPVVCFCRADPRFANVIARPDGRIGFVDWEDCGLRDPACDVADVVMHANQEDLVTPELWRVFLDAYLPARRAVDPTFDERAACFRSLFVLRWVAVQLKTGLERVQSGRLGGWAINGRPPNWRLRRYVARGRAWPEGEFGRKPEGVEGLTFFPGVE